MLKLQMLSEPVDEVAQTVIAAGVRNTRAETKLCDDTVPFARHEPVVRFAEKNEILRYGMYVLIPATTSSLRS
jgi:hypothetical protein